MQIYFNIDITQTHSNKRRPPTHAVQYATDVLTQKLIVSKYRLQLPSENDIRKYLLDDVTEVTSMR